MPITVSYPGVYVQELPSGPRSAVEVPTSITAFIGRALMGPVNEPVVLTSWGDYQRVFGGLATDSAMSFQVSAFFNNGGSEAIAVRLFEPAAAGAVATVALSPGDLVLDAASPGAWGNGLTAEVDVAGITAASAASVGVADPADLFNLTLTLNGGRVAERFGQVTLNPAYPARLLERVLAEQSSLAVVVGGAAAPAGATGAGSGGADSAPLALATYLGDQSQHTGLYALEQAPVFNILCIPPDIDGEDTPNLVYETAATYCVQRRAMLIVDPPTAWQTAFDAGRIGTTSLSDLSDLGGFGGAQAANSAVYFPRVLAQDPVQVGAVRSFPNSGYVAGIWAATDARRGVWKAPAGTDAGLNGIQGLAAKLTDDDSGLLNPLGINCLRSFPGFGPVVWGARTLAGADVLADDYKYVPVRRLALYIENWCFQNMSWAVFEPNDEPLWSQLRLQAGSLMQGLYRDGALVGSTPSEAFFVHCDQSTTTLENMDQGVVNLLIGFAPVKPAEFIILSIQQMTAAPVG